MTTADWIALAGAIGTGLAALGTIAAVIFAAKSVRASERTVAVMNEQWQRDRADRQRAEHLRRLSLVSTLYNQCDAIRHTYLTGSQAQLTMDEWRKSRAEIALIDEELAGLMRGLELLVERHNAENHFNAQMVYGPAIDNLRARLVAAKLGERPAIVAESEAFAKEGAEDAKKRYEKTLLTVKDAMTRLSAIYKVLKEMG